MTSPDERCLILAPQGRDAEVIAAILARADVASLACRGFEELVAAVTAGVGAAVVTEEALLGQDLRTLTSWLDAQEPWSDLPFIILAAQRREPRPRDAPTVLADLANVVLLERPINAETLQRAAASALRARRRQYSARDDLQERRKFADRLELALRAGRLGAWSLDLATHDLDLSTQCKANFGRGADERLDYGDLVAAIHPDDRARQQAVVRDAIETGREFEIEYRVAWPNGDWHWIEIRGRAMRNDANDVCGLTGVSQDITARRDAQAAIEAGRAALQDLNETLEQRIAARTEDVAAANSRLLAEVADKGRMQSVLAQAQKMEAVGQLTGGVAHDFNNLLTIVRSSVDFLRRPDLTEDRRLRYVEAISQTVDRASKLTGQLLAFARRQALTPTVFDVGRQVESVVDLIHPLVGERVAIETRLCPTACFAKADVSQFETALINLAVNARDAMNGEGRLRIEVDAVGDVPAIRGHASASGAFVVVSVTDTGAGIAPEHLARIFEPFFTTKEVGHGTGLGLSQVFGFAKQSGGEVDVDTVPGRGTVFRLYLPHVEGARAPDLAPGRRSQRPHAAGEHLRVLLVEDNDEVGRFAIEMLTDLGYAPTRAANADEALARLGAGERFDVVFSDVVMPGISGLDMARTIRRHFPDLPVLLTSGYSNVLAEQGTHGFELLHKPYSVQALADRLSRVSGLSPRTAGPR